MKTTKFMKTVPAVVFSLLSSLMLVTPSFATIGTISKSDLQGPWQMTLVGNTGCGLTSMLVNVSLNNTGTGSNATIIMHGSCGDSTITGQTFVVQSMNANGSGTANLSCGTGCGWNLRIQVAPDRSTFNIVDIDPVNPGNFLAGMAVHQ